MTEYGCFYRPATNTEKITVEEWIKRYRPISIDDFDYYPYLDKINNHYKWSLVDADEGGKCIMTGAYLRGEAIFFTGIPWKEEWEVQPHLDDENSDIYSGYISAQETRGLTDEELQEEYKKEEERKEKVRRKKEIDDKIIKGLWEKYCGGNDA
jgi:hypothetical protein